MRWAPLSAAAGAVLVVVGLAAALAVPGGTDPSSLGGGLLFAVVLASLVAVVAKTRGSLDEPAGAVPWSGGDAFGEPAPERAADDRPLSSVALPRTVDRAAARAQDGTVDDGIEVVRSPLRGTLESALVAGGRPGSEARRAVESGAWTDDPVAASVLSPDVDPPPQSLRDRVVAWLFPERVLRKRVRRATGEVARAADEALPTVPGQTAPRTVPVVRPPLERLRRGVDDNLSEPADPGAVDRGPTPPRADLEGVDGDD